MKPSAGLFALVLATGLLTFGAQPASAAQVMTYRDCLALSDVNPVKGFDAALAWSKDGGGDSARHFMAMSLVGQG